MGVFPQAFALRPNEDSPSVNWIEYFDGDHETQIKKTVHELRLAIGVKKTSAFSVLNIAHIKDVCTKNGASVRVVYDPRTNIDTHSEIRRFPRDDLALQESLAASAFSKLVQNNEIGD